MSQSYSRTWSTNDLPQHLHHVHGQTKPHHPSNLQTTLLSLWSRKPLFPVALPSYAAPREPSRGLTAIPDVARCPVTTFICNFAPYTFHVSVKKWWSKDTGLPHPWLNKEKFENTSPHFRTLSGAEWSSFILYEFHGSAKCLKRGRTECYEIKIGSE